MNSRRFIDQTGHSSELPMKPVRIVSLVPSQTELLFYLGLESRIVGVTKFCIHPKAKVKGISKVGGTKKINFLLVNELKPDLIIANKEENSKEEIERLQNEFPVWTSNILDIEDAKEMMSEVGRLTQTELKASELVDEIDRRWKSLENLHSGSVLYFIWQNPFMIVANDTFINYILHHLGFDNLAKDLNRYPELSIDQLNKCTPDYVFLSSEPFPFQKKHLKSFQKIFPESKVILVDGEMFSWYGNRLLLAPEYFKSFSL